MATQVNYLIGKSLRDFVKSNKPRGFKRTPFYSADGDFLSLVLENADHYAERVDEYLTVYRAFADGKFVGFRLKGVAVLLAKAESLNLQLYQGSELLVQALLVAGGLTAGAEGSLVYQDFIRVTRDMVVKVPTAPAPNCEPSLSV